MRLGLAQEPTGRRSVTEILLAIAGGVIGIAAGVIIVLWHRW